MFLSDMYGGRSTDSAMVIESGLIDLIEEGDQILADKGFPGKIIENGGRSEISGNVRNAVW